MIREKLRQIWHAFSRPRTIFLVVGVVWIFFVSALKTSWLSDYTQKKLEFAQVNNERIFNAFQADFYFYYDEQFKPTLEEFLRKNQDLRRVSVVSSSNMLVIFDSDDLAAGKTSPRRADPRTVPKSGVSEIVPDGDGIGVSVPVGQYVIYYVFKTTQITKKVALLVFLGLMTLGVLWYLIEIAKPHFVFRGLQFAGKYIKLHSIRTKFVATIVLVNILTGAIIFVSQSYTQKNEQTRSLVNNSVSLAELSRDQIISNFSNYFYFYYNDKFVPAIKQVIASKENLAVIRIISKKSGMVVFDSEDIASGKQPVPGMESRRASLSEEAQNDLKSRDTYWTMLNSEHGDQYIQVVTSYRNENGEVPFYVEYLFTFTTLKKRVGAIQKQILIDLIPSMLLGIVIATLFSQLIVGPIKRLLNATKAITTGNYDVYVETRERDELGELMRSFNTMAEELRRKGELKKYLSAHSYRKITESPSGAANLGGSRVKATVLFCDIRNFVNVCESLDAEEVTALLNDYFSAMVEVIYKHKGEVDKFIGDAILAVFYEHETGRQAVNTALHSVYCAMEMRERLAEFNARRVRNDKSPIEIGIGINSGEIISGPIGSPDRMDYTVIGDVVNLANRIEKLSKQGRHTRIVFSNRVEEKVRGLLEYEELSRDKIRGKEEDVIVYELVRIKDVTELLGNLSNPDPQVKRHCIELLGYSRNMNALDSLYQKLSDSNDGVRIAAVNSIAHLSPKNHDQALEILFKQLEHETSQRVVSAILMGIGRMCTTTKLARITKYLSHKDDRIVANAIEALAGADDPALIDQLIPFVASKSNRVKANAAMVLFSKGRVEVLDTLKPMLLHSDAMMRASAAFALGELTVLAAPEVVAGRLKENSRSAKQFLGELQSCVPLLVSLLKDTDAMVKRQAIVALGKIKDKTAVLPLLDNINLDTDSKELVHDIADALRSIGSHRLVHEVVRNLS